MSRLADISAKPAIREFAQGAAQQAIQPVANFIAPPVDVPTSVGRYKVYTEKNRFRIPNTQRALGGRAVALQFDAEDATYNCEPHAIDFPIDNLERLEVEQLEDAVKEAAVAVAEVAALAHEKSVIDKALAAAGSGTGKTWNSSADPVDDIDAAILAVLKAAKYGSLMGVGVLFGAGAWKLFKNHAAVRGRFIVGAGARAGATGAAFAVPTEDLAGDLFLGKPQVRTSYMVYDTAAEGLQENISFLLDNVVLVFARKDQPTRRDPSFMKTFRLMGQWMVPGSYSRDDGRVEVAKFDWSEDVVVTNSAAVVRYNVSAS